MDNPADWILFAEPGVAGLGKRAQPERNKDMSKQLKDIGTLREWLGIVENRRRKLEAAEIELTEARQAQAELRLCSLVTLENGAQIGATDNQIQKMRETKWAGYIQLSDVADISDLIKERDTAVTDAEKRVEKAEASIEVWDAHIQSLFAELRERQQ